MQSIIVVNLFFLKYKNRKHFIGRKKCIILFCFYYYVVKQKMTVTEYFKLNVLFNIKFLLNIVFNYIKLLLK